jgi:hypothetical protein
MGTGSGDEKARVPLATGPVFDQGAHPAILGSAQGNVEWERRQGASSKLRLRKGTSTLIGGLRGGPAAGAPDVSECACPQSPPAWLVSLLPPRSYVPHRCHCSARDPLPCTLQRRLTQRAGAV